MASPRLFGHDRRPPGASKGDWYRLHLSNVRLFLRNAIAFGNANSYRLEAAASAVDINPGLRVRALTVSHGSLKEGSTYDSSAFFLSVPTSDHEVLFFGDVEPGMFYPPNFPVSD